MNNTTRNTNIITSVNLDGRLSNLISLENTINKYNPLVCLLQDIPKLSEDNLLDTCRTVARGYNAIFDIEELNRRKRLNNLILIDSNRIEVKQIHNFDNRCKAAALGISICCIQNGDSNDGVENNGDCFSSKLIIFSVYIRPRASHEATKSLFDLISERSSQHEGHSRLIIAGDMNATEPTWCPIQHTLLNKENSATHYRQIKQMRGRIIIKAANMMKITCLNKINQGPTFIHLRGSAYIDLIFVGNKAIRTWNSMSLEKLSDNSAHKIMILQARGPLKPKYKKRNYRKICSDMINESQFDETHIKCDQLCNNWKHLPRDRIINRLERLTDILYNAIAIAQEKVTIRVSRKVACGRMRNGTCHRIGITNVRIRKQLKRLHKQEIKLNRTNTEIRRLKIRRTYNNNNNNNINTENENQLNVAENDGNTRRKRSIKLQISRLRKTIMNNININNLNREYDNLGEQELWERIHLIDNNLNYKSNCIEVDHNGIQTLNDLEQLADTKFPHINRKMLNYVNIAYKKRNSSIKTQISEDEIITAVMILRKKSYTSSVGIRMDIFYKSLMYVTNIITAIAEMSFWVAYIPKKACITQGTLIPKKAAGQFRIVHVSSPFAALLEIIALRRLEYRLETLKLNSVYQFGFSALISRHDLVARMLEFFFKAYIRDGRTAAGLIFSLDIEGAFDNVNQDILISKMETELGNDPIKYWLANFLLNRQIRIKKGTLRSQSKDICTGVPQGSALGPILWNYTINKLDTDVCIPCKAELIRYADDIILIYNGSNKEEIQDVLNRLVHKLKELDLNIRPEKCSVMGIRLGMHDRRHNYYHINNVAIRKAKWINLLGIPINNKLKLYRGSEEHTNKLFASIKKLHSLNNLGYIRTAKEWRILIDSYIKSRLILNNWPVLLIDHRSCKWTDEIMIKALRLIFGWPNNTSTKLIQLITSSLDCKTIVNRLAEQRALTEFSSIYNFLIRLNSPEVLTGIMQLDQHRRTIRANETPIVNLETDIIRRRKHPNPEKTIRINEVNRIENEIKETGPTWITLERSGGTMIVQISTELQAIDLRIGKHNEYSISYFNTFALLLKIVADRCINFRCLTLSDTNSLLGALENPHNKDWRIITIRERMFDNGWRINRITKAEEIRFVTRISDKYKTINIENTTDNIARDLHTWMNNTRSNAEENQGSNRRGIRLHHNIQTLSEPYLSDYKRRNYLNKWIPIEDNTLFQRLHTRTTRELCNRVTVWQNLNPSWLDGSKMLVLSGLVTNAQGQLEHGNRSPSDICHLCESIEEDGLRRYTIIGPSGLAAEAIRGNLILHRAFICKALIDIHEQFLNKIRPEVLAGNAATSGREFIEQILSNRRISQKFLSYLVKCAFEK